MPNTIGPNGLQTKTQQEIIAELLNGTAAYQGLLAIYGSGININPNTPDGQLLNLIAQVCTDMEELLAQINASFDPDQAVGTILDARCAINGVVREGATYTIQNVLVTVGQAMTLPGMDTPTPFIVADSNGNQFQLMTSYSFSGAGAVSLAFQAVQVGPVQTTIGTIAQIVTAILGVLSVNNPTAATTIGLAQETDAALRIRRANSVSLPSKGFLQGLLGALIDIVGVIQAVVYENITNSTDARGIPGHSIWVIVNAPPSAYGAVAEAIYVKRNAGCGMNTTGTGATAGAATVGGGAVSAIAVATPGTGYTIAPLVVIGGPGTGATAHATIGGGIVTGIVIDSGGSGYSTPPVCTLVSFTQVVPVAQIDGTNFNVFFDIPVKVPLFISFNYSVLTGGDPGATFIRNQLLALLTYQIGQTADVTSIEALIHQIAPNIVITAEGVSLTNSGYAATLTPAAVNDLFVPSLVTVYINGSHG